MPRYRYTARYRDGDVEEGTLDAASLYDFYGVMNDQQLEVLRVVNIPGGPVAPPPPAKRRWPVPVFSLLLGLLAGLLLGSWLPLPFQTTMLLVPGMAVLTLVALLTWRTLRAGPLLGPHLVEELQGAPSWLRWLLALLQAAALGQLAAALGQFGWTTPVLVLGLRGVLAVGTALPLVVIGSGMAAGLRGRLS